MNTLLLPSGLLACLPLMAAAELQQDLNGLAITTLLGAAPIHAVEGSAISRGASQILRVTNQSGQTVECRVQPGLADAMRPLGRSLTLPPGDTATLLVDSRPIGRDTDARLFCTAEDERPG
ncbi:hypothetical protein JQX08_07700 [Pseudomonas sp. UL073]|uniref:3-phosphoglycerate kinase n=1 Tax=Zestomonas insulae TaxID=2809017 RepID=A0ABS2IFD3_9GAMM|nr:hypothetical protein [Pseudomonas insulae]MBM7060590.1 hypothetical protein [Pseudomonas insulae]